MEEIGALPILTGHFVHSQAADEVKENENAAIGFWSAFIWLVGMTAVIALLSEFVVGTIEARLYITTLSLIKYFIDMLITCYLLAL